MYAIIGGDTLDLLKGSPSIEQRIGERSVASIVVVDTAGTKTFETGEPVAIYDSSDTLVFGGKIDTPEMIAVAPSGELYHTLNCVDWHWKADKRLVVATYTDESAGTIVTALHTDYLSAEGIGIGAIQAGPTISEAIFNYIKVSDALDAIAELAGFIWYIDESQDLYFIDRSTNDAPFDADAGTNIIKGSAVLSGGNPLFRNRQYIRGGTGLTSQQTENFTGDGVINTFACGYPLAKEPTITEDAGGKTVGIKEVDSGKDYYWSKGDEVVVAAVAPLNTVAVQIKYYGQYPLITRATNDASILARATIEGGSGITENLVDEAYHESSESSNESASAKLADYCRTASKFSYQTTTSGLRPGQLQKITFTALGLTATEMLIESVSMHTLGTQEIYDVVAILGPATGSWTKFFSSLAKRQDSALKIGSNKLLVLQQQSEDLDLIESTDRHEDAIASDYSRWIAIPPDQGEGYHIRSEIMSLSESTSRDEHTTEDYKWDDADMKWDFFTWA